MAKKKAKVETKQWTWLPPNDRAEPATAITQESVREFRNGLAKFSQIKENADMMKTLTYRAVIDLDHLLRLMTATPGTIIAQWAYTVKPANKKSAVKMAKEVMRNSKWKKVK